MKQPSKKTGASGVTRTKRSAAAVAVPADFLTESEVVELAGRAGVSVTPGTLRNYRYRWTNGLPGEYGPRWFTGFGGRIKVQEIRCGSVVEACPGLDTRAQPERKTNLRACPSWGPRSWVPRPSTRLARSAWH